MNKFKSAFTILSEAFSQQNIKAVLIGGFAVNYYKVTRQTADVDFLISEENFNALLPLLEKNLYKISHRQDVFVQLSCTDFHLMDIDFMFVDENTLNEIYDTGVTASIAQNEFIVPSLDHLIALKLHSIKFNQKIREYKDLPDIINLISENSVDVNSADFIELCKKFGTEELYSKISNHFNGNS